MIALPDRAPKYPQSPDRCCAIEDTAKSIPLLRERIGISRVGDTTLLDRTGIPTFCAIVPKSSDILSVYNGKGRTLDAARVSAVMEALERQAAAHAILEAVPHRVADLLEHLPLDQLDLLPDLRDQIVDCVVGLDLITGKSTPVPHALVRFPWRGMRLFGRSSTNGLASGNNLTEAIYHALMEMAERHVWSLFYVRSELVPRFYRGGAVGDRVHARALRFPTGNAVLDELHATIKAADLHVRVLVLDEPNFPSVVLAHVLEPSSEPPMAHIGLGCSLSTAHAAERALTEAVQSRVVDLQAAREDIKRADDISDTMEHGRRLAELPKNRWYVDLPVQEVPLRECADFATDDLAEDLRHLLRMLVTAGIRNAVAVDISPSDQPMHVVRIVAPDFETTAVDGRLGPIARNEFNPFKSRSYIRV